MVDSDDNDDNDNGSAAEVARKRPNILITGTPGVGKTATASLLAVRVCVLLCVTFRLMFRLGFSFSLKTCHYNITRW